MTSQINPNNIDGNYPTAGVSNNTQGMRDNFTNIKQNFQYAETEIDDLQSKVLLKAALTGTTLDNNMADNLIYAAKIQDFSATQVLLAATSGAVAVDYSAGHYQTLAMAGNVSLSFTNFPASGSVGMLRMQVIVGTAGLTLTLPAAVSLGTTGVQGYSGNVITFATTGTFEFGFVTSDAGAAITIFDLNRPLSYYTNPVTVASTTVSTSSGSGALIVSGGVGIGGNLYVSGNIVGSIVATGNTFAGNTTVGNLLTAGFVSATANITGGNVLSSGIMSAAGNITGGNVLTTALSLSGNVLSVINSTANITTTANIQAGNLKSSGIMSATANVTGGNILTGGLISATANITSAANIAGGNILTNGLLSVTGNITGGNVITANVNSTIFTGNNVSVAGNITGGNLITPAAISAVSVSASGNITGGNVLGGANVNATLFTGTTVSVTGNITGGNVLGGANVNATTHTGTTVSVTGNITGGNVLSSAVISAVGNAIVLSGTAIPVGGTAGAGYKFSSTANFGIFFGSGAPALAAAKGSLYLRSDGTTTNDRMYVNTDGATTWAAVTTVA